jgi:hypothetical protein
MFFCGTLELGIDYALPIVNILRKEVTTRGLLIVGLSMTRVREGRFDNLLQKMT